MIAKWWGLTKKFVGDQFTTSNGDFDPARVWGYMVIGTGGMLYNWFEYYWVVTKGQPFDPIAYADGLIKVGAALLAAATGVWIKHGTEIPYNPNNPNQGGGGDDVVTQAVNAAQDQAQAVGQLAQTDIDQAKNVFDKLADFWRHIMTYFNK
jgi:hypothetical protein